MRLRRTHSAVALLFLFLALAGPCAAQDVLVAPGTPLPFVERIQPPDFSAVEATLPEPLGKTADVVIICTEDGRPAFALTVGKNPETEFEVVLILFWPENAAEATGRPPRQVAPLDAKSAERLQRALAIKLARNVFLSSAMRKAGDYRTAWWILQRSGTNQIQAALITRDNAHMNSDAQDFLDAFVDDLKRYATCHPDDRSQVLYEIDRYTIKTILEERARK